MSHMSTEKSPTSRIKTDCKHKHHHLHKVIGTCEAAPHNHLVHFHNSKENLVDSVIEFFMPSLIQDEEAVVVIATDPHWELLQQKLKLFGIDVQAKINSGQLTFVDARATLDEIKKSGEIDSHTFFLIIGGLIDKVQAKFPRIRLFGEMVGLLTPGRPDQAVELEELWNILSQYREFLLLCSYPQLHFCSPKETHPHPNSQVQDQICSVHTDVVPAVDHIGEAVQRQMLKSIYKHISLAEKEERQRRNTQTQLELAVKREKIAEEESRNMSSFMSYMCHEIRNPLHGVLGHLNLMEDNLRDLKILLIAHKQTHLNDIFVQQEKEREKQTGGVALSNSQQQQQNLLASGQTNTILTRVEATNTKQEIIDSFYSKLDESISDIRTCIAYQSTILNDNLDVAQLAEGRLSLESQEFELASLLEEIIKMFKPSASKKNLVLSLSLCAKRICVQGDRHRILQVVSNLMTNAIKFSQSGRVSVAITESQTSMEPVIPPICEHEKKTRTFDIVVQDTGKGLSEVELALLFHRFSQARKVGDTYGGSGLGLWICKNLASLMGGSINVQSKKGVGSTFTFTLSLPNSFICSCDSLYQKNPSPRQQSPIPLNLSTETEKTEINNTNNFLAMPRDAHTQTDIEYTSSIGTPTPPTPQNLTPTPFTNSIQTPVSTTPLLARIKQLQEKQDRQQQQQQQTLSGSPTPNTYSQNNSPETKPQKISPKSELNRKPKVLIVDDNQINRKILGAYIQQSNKYECYFASDGKSAIEKHNEIHADVILMDLHMPIMDGFEATKMIRQQEEVEGSQSRVAIIAISASPQEEIALMGMNDFIHKPFTKSVLLEKIDQSFA